MQPVGELWASSYDGGGAECEGDCDDDSDCSGDLLCFQRDEGDTDPVPGCSGSFWLDFDYCYNPTEQCDEDGMYAVDWHSMVCLFGGYCLSTIARCVGTHPLYGTMMMWDRGSSIITVLIA